MMLFSFSSTEMSEFQSFYYLGNSFQFYVYFYIYSVVKKIKAF